MLKFFGSSEYNLKIDVNHIENRIKQCAGKYSRIEIEKQTGGGFYNWLPTENRINVGMRVSKKFDRSIVKRIL